MNVLRPHLAVISYVFRFWLSLRRLLPRRQCQTFGVQREEKCPRIEKIYVINLDREPGRWSKMKQELKRILDSTGAELLNLAERHVAVDANEFSQDPLKDADIDPIYTLENQLFVEPQPLALPTLLELNAPIRMSRAECAVAQSHVNVWRQVAASNDAYVLILEDDVWFRSGFAKYLDKVWNEIVSQTETSTKFDILYLSYLEVKHGAPKTNLSRNVFKPVRGLWHLSGYVLSREGAEKLLRRLPCRGPVDLWINYQFESLNVLAANCSFISQRRDTKSTNSYSILPSLTRIGAITSEGASLFNIRPIEQPVFAFGSEGSGLSSLAMALSMLGYRCCSDFKDIPVLEMERLFEGKGDRVFNAYVNIGCLEEKVKALQILYPKAKFILTAFREVTSSGFFMNIEDGFEDADLTILHLEELNKWRVICEHLRCAPPTCSYPTVKDLGQRLILNENSGSKEGVNVIPVKRDSSPWVVEFRKWWRGICPVATEIRQTDNGRYVDITDRLEFHDTRLWLQRTDTFTDNLALFRRSNVEYSPGVGALLSLKRESVGVRDYSAAAISSHDQYLFGKFEATIQASNVPGVVTGFFLHRNSPRQEIDIEIAGNRPDRLIINVFYNPGSDEANFDYGYRGSPSYIDLGFDASKSSHRFAIEWSPFEIKWLVDGIVVHKRAVWDPTPIPHLPMTLHVNSWISRSTELAGRIDSRRLPTVTIVRGISIAANVINPKPEAEDPRLQTKPNNFNSSQFLQ